MAEMDSASSTGVNLASDMRRRNVPHTEGLRRKPDGTEESKRKPQLKANPSVSILDNWEPLIMPILLTAVAIFTRMYRIGRSNIVTWDEAQ